MLGDELLNYRVCRDMSECADGVGVHACGTDISWALGSDAGWVVGGGFTALTQA